MLTFNEKRLKAITFLSDEVPRIVVCVVPYFPDCHKQIMAEIPRYAEAGAYAVMVGSYITKKKTKGMTRYGGNYFKRKQSTREKKLMHKRQTAVKKKLQRCLGTHLLRC